MAKAWKEEMPPLAPWREPNTVRTISGSMRTCTPRETMVSSRPTPSRITMVKCVVIQSAICFSTAANSSTSVPYGYCAGAGAPPTGPPAGAAPRAPP